MYKFILESLSIADPDLGQDNPNNPNHISLSLATIFGLKYLNSLMRIRDPGSGMETVRIRDPGWKKVASGIRDKHPGSATLESLLVFESLEYSFSDKAGYMDVFFAVQVKAYIYIYIY
jgi:hypothetical protein